MNRPPTDPAKPTLDSLRPRLTGLQWSSRLLGVVAVLVALAWAWQDSGMSASDKLWNNRQRAVDYILGQPVDASTIEMRRREIDRELRTRFQSDERVLLEQKYETRGEPKPGVMQLMLESEQRAAKKIEQISPVEWERMIQARLDEQGTGRQGGYVPPETDPAKIFGDPSELDDLHPAVAWAVPEPGEGGAWGRAVRGVFTALTGEGYTGKLFETIAIALWGTLIAIVIVIPASLLGASRSLEVLAPGNSAAHRLLRWVGRFFVRRSFDISRGFNEIIMAMIFVAVLGLGPLPGVLALMIHTYGVLGKVIAEAIDTIDGKPVEGVTSTGAAPTQIISLAILPQIMPYLISQSLLRFETNVRGATILGVVGAGGIGQLLMDKFGAYEFKEVATIMIIIIVVVTLIDFACGKVMRKVV